MLLSVAGSHGEVCSEVCRSHTGAKSGIDMDLNSELENNIPYFVQSNVLKRVSVRPYYIVTNGHDDYFSSHSSAC